MRHNSARQMINRIETFDKVPTLITSRNRGAQQHSTYSSAKNVKEDTQEATFSSKIRSRSNISPVSVNIECKHLDFSRKESLNAPFQSKFNKAMQLDRYYSQFEDRKLKDRTDSLGLEYAPTPQKIMIKQEKSTSQKSASVQLDEKDLKFDAIEVQLDSTGQKQDQSQVAEAKDDAVKQIDDLHPSMFSRPESAVIQTQETQSCFSYQKRQEKQGQDVRCRTIKLRNSIITQDLKNLKRNEPVLVDRTLQLSIRGHFDRISQTSMSIRPLETQASELMPQNLSVRQVETQTSEQIRANSAFGVYEKGGAELTTEDLSSSFIEPRPFKQASMPEINTSLLFSPKTAEQQSDRRNITNKSVDWESVKQKL